ncbi:MAG: hypothetical protein KJN76_00520, partial [Eudoraea sp.]|nr:hypothetical protein [Eudoraea sp.]
MKTIAKLKLTGILLLLMCFSMGYGQLTPNVYLYEEQSDKAGITHELKIDKGYLIYSKFIKNPAEFISTVGGFYT